MVTLLRLGLTMEPTHTHTPMGTMISMLIFGTLATVFLVLLLQTLVAHAELAIHNISCVESHYETPDDGNPYDMGDYKVNLEQVLGACGWDWLFPIRPRLPIP